MEIIKNPKKATWNSILERPTFSVESLGSVVNEVFDAVQKDGDIAIKKYTQKFDGVCIDNFSAFNF